MEIGYRIIRPDDVGKQPLQLAQISLWRVANWRVAVGQQAVKEAMEIEIACKERQIRTVYHPIEYPLTGDLASHSMDVMQQLALTSDLGMIIHDESGADGNRLSKDDEKVFEQNVLKLSSICPISIENAINSHDITWFWERFVLKASENVSITIDIGHMESAGIDSIDYVRLMPERFVERVNYIHLHHKAEERYGIKDHWPLVLGCREIEALKVFIKRKPNVRVILELNAAKPGMGQSIELLKDIS
ncbi:MAG TPA: hypothetical protein VLX29_08600 [Nitrospirota bacterium]|nr:hypothetical protein [Nitrospirota bacterium]